MAPTAPPSYRQYRRHRRYLICTCCLLLLAIIAIVVLVLMFVVFKIDDPTTEVASANVTGVIPPITGRPENYRLNLTIDLSVLVRNPNRATFSYDASHTGLIYQDTSIGGADVPSGSISARGSGAIQLRLKVDPDLLPGGSSKLLEDVNSGAVDFDAETALSGKMAILGFIKLNSATTSQCHIVIGFPELKVRSSVCTPKTNT